MCTCAVRAGGKGCAVHSHAGVSCLALSLGVVKSAQAKSFKLRNENARADLLQRFRRNQHLKNCDFERKTEKSKNGSTVSAPRRVGLKGIDQPIYSTSAVMRFDFTSSVV